MTLQLGRRSFLRGLGACLALPHLPSIARAMDPPPKRLIYYFIPNGVDMSTWTPTGTGAGYTLSPTLASLAPFVDDMLVISGLDNRPAWLAPDNPNGGHHRSTVSFLSCATPTLVPEAAAQSVDQIAAEALGYVTPHRSLQLGMAAGGSGTCGGTWPCSFLSNISWADPNTPVAKHINPGGLFLSLFGPGAVGVSQDEFEKRRGYDQSILDVVRQDANALMARLGTADRHKLDQYLTAVNETEARVNALTFGLDCEPGDPPGSASTYPEKLELMLDLMAMALHCDATRIISFMTHSDGASHHDPYDWVTYQGHPIPETKHAVSHHRNDPDLVGKLSAICTWEVSVFAGLLQRLSDMNESDGTSLLDNCGVLFGSGLSDGNLHTSDNLPLVVAGRMQGALRGGEHLSFSAPLNTYADLHIALLHAFGVPVSTFGDGTAPLPGVLT